MIRGGIGLEVGFDWTECRVSVKALIIRADFIPGEQIQIISSLKFKALVKGLFPFNFGQSNPL